MKLEYNGKTVYELSAVQKKVIKNDIPSDVFESDMLRRCSYWLCVPAEKYAHAKRESMPKEIQAKGRAFIPTNLVKMAALHCELHPCKCGYEDLKPVQCKVGDLSFEFSVDHQKICRKMKEQQQEQLGREAYMAQEEKDHCDRMAWILQYKYERCFERLRLEWLPKLEARGMAEIPSDPDEFAELVFAQPDYKDRAQRELAENKA